MDITEIYTPEMSETGKNPLKYYEIMLALFFSHLFPLPSLGF